MTNETDNLEQRARGFQDRVQPWLLKCFGPEIAGDRTERNHRFLEEALELVQSCGCTQSEARQLVDYTFGRPPGEPSQEVGGVMVTLAALCLAHGLDMRAAGNVELVRVWKKIDAIRAKQAAKPKHSPLPEYTRAAPTEDVVERVARAICSANCSYSGPGTRGGCYGECKASAKDLRANGTFDQALAALAAIPQPEGEREKAANV